MRLIEIFSGIGAQQRGLSRLPFESEVVATLDVDKDAVLSYASMRYDIEEEIVKYNFPSKSDMVAELQNCNLGFDFRAGKHTITERMSEDRIKQYYIAHKLSKNYGDVSKCGRLPETDILFHSSPCTSFSLAGLGQGGDEGSGTESSLMWESMRIIGINKPKYVIWENVAPVLSPKHRHNFLKMLVQLSNYGYENTFNLLNAKDYGIPQNRLRIFCISRLTDSPRTIVENDAYNYTNRIVRDIRELAKADERIKFWNNFMWPEEIPLSKHLKDMLEPSVDASYYLSKGQIDCLLNNGFLKQSLPNLAESNEIEVVGHCMPACYATSRVISTGGIAPTVMENHGSVIAILEVREATKRGYAVVEEGDSVNLENPNSKTRRGRVGKGVAQTITTSPQQVVCEPFAIACRGRNVDSNVSTTQQRLEPNFTFTTNTLTSVAKDNYIAIPERFEDFYWRVRKLTPKEYWRLMGFSDEDIDRASQFVSKSFLYKQAGNSIVTDVLTAIFSSMFIENGHKKEIWSSFCENI